MQDEINSMYKNEVQRIIDLLEIVKPIGCKCVFTRKRNSERKMERYKACLVAKGFTKQYSIDYDETFSPIVHIQSIRTILSLVIFL